MKLLKFSLLFLGVLVLVLLKSQRVDKKEVAVVEAIKGVLSGHFAPNEPKVDLFVYGQSSKDLAHELLREKPSEVSFRVVRRHFTNKR
jgi:hypothetical protein